MAVQANIDHSLLYLITVDQYSLDNIETLSLIHTESAVTDNWLMPIHSYYDHDLESSTAYKISANVITPTEGRSTTLNKDKETNIDYCKCIFASAGRFKIKPVNITVNEKADPFQAHIEECQLL